MKNREEELDEVYKLLEKDLRLLGATAIEDKLQDKVPETIALLREAGIRFWMLTGDKFSTALTIANNCNLRPTGSRLVSVDGASEEEVKEALETQLAALKAEHYFVQGMMPARGKRGKELSKLLLDIRPPVNNPTRTATAELSASQRIRLGSLSTSEPVIGYTLIITGTALHYALQEENIEKLELLCLVARAVVCCRVTPKQKRLLVELVKRAGFLALAIGDGGNDVGMIQEAQVGVGIRGKEGLQAARTADYSVSFFRALQRLVLVHGRWSYYRTALVAQYSFYKSFLFCFLQVTLPSTANLVCDLHHLLADFSCNRLLMDFTLALLGFLYSTHYASRRTMPCFLFQLYFSLLTAISNPKRCSSALRSAPGRAVFGACHALTWRASSCRPII